MELLQSGSLRNENFFANTLWYSRVIDKLKDARIIVTGGLGFIGSHLCRKLCQVEAEVHAISRKPETKFWRIRDFTDKLYVHQLDLLDLAEVENLISNIKPDYVFHLAASTDVSRSMELMYDVYKNNVMGTINLVRALTPTKIKRLVNVGTCEEYGDGLAPFCEEQRECPVSPYSASLVAKTHLFEMLAKIFQLPAVNARIFLTYGPYQINNMLIPYLILKSLRGESVNLTPGGQTREFNYVGDVVCGLIRCALAEEAVGETINIGNGIEFTIKDVAMLIVALNGVNINLNFGALSYRPGEVMHFYCANEKAASILAWKPQVSLEEGLKITIQWFKENWERLGKDIPIEEGCARK